MKRVILLRHGKTPGNEEKRYIGRTDESLSEQTRKEIEEKREQICRTYGLTEKTQFVLSPMKRCEETLKLLFPQGVCLVTIKDMLKECDFGDFEGKNYKELANDVTYQAWIDSGGTMDFPNGEKIADFKSRCGDAFLQVMEERTEDKSEKKGKKEAENDICFLVHGGTIMAIAERFALPKREYFSYQISNLEALIFAWDEKQKVLKSATKNEEM